MKTEADTEVKQPQAMGEAARQSLLQPQKGGSPAKPLTLDFWPSQV
jgi:hypothetical protein